MKKMNKDYGHATPCGDEYQPTGGVDKQRQDVEPKRLDDLTSRLDGGERFKEEVRELRAYNGE